MTASGNENWPLPFGNKEVIYTFLRIAPVAFKGNFGQLV
jgi:hypothetical protein